MPAESFDDLVALVNDTLIAVVAMLDRTKVRGDHVDAWRHWAIAWVGRRPMALRRPLPPPLPTGSAPDIAYNAMWIAGGAAMSMRDEDYDGARALCEEASRLALFDLRPELQGKPAR